MTIVIRPPDPSEHRQAAESMAIPLMFAPADDESWARSAPSWDEMVSFTAWEGDSCLGHAGQFPVDTVVPGGALVATAAVTRVGVMPTARRRGIATELMNTLIRDAAERGQVLASLRASEATIYGRFGFGVAGDIAEGTIDPVRAGSVRGAADGGSLRLLEPDEIVETTARLYDQAMRRTVGAVSRPASWTQRYRRAAVERTAGSFVVVHTDADGTDDGFAHYQVRWTDPSRGEPNGTGRGHLAELWAIDDAAELALWRYLLELDLVRAWTYDERPTDDLIRAAITDRRAHQITAVNDEQWLRIIDVDAALRERAYRPMTATFTVAVSDPLLAANNGSWRIGPDGVEATEAPADIATGIVGLSQTYLGGVAWSQLVGFGAASAHRPEAIAIADAAMATDRHPFCGSFF